MSDEDYEDLDVVVNHIDLPGLFTESQLCEVFLEVFRATALLTILLIVLWADGEFRQLLECLESVDWAPKVREWSPVSFLKILSTWPGLNGSIPVLSHPDLMLPSIKVLSKAE